MKRIARGALTAALLLSGALATAVAGSIEAGSSEGRAMAADPNRPPGPPAMEPWERELWERHIGTWKSSYTIRDAEGNIVDQHEAINDIALDWEQNLYSQRNIYTRGEETEVRRYTAHWEGSEMVIRGKVLEGRARAYDQNTIILWFSKPSLGEETYETIILGREPHRGRSMQHWENGVLVRTTSVFGEVKTSDLPAIDAAGHDLPAPAE
ncbi:MAG: hypothetical protein AAF604_06320 [Acidobacteriota bacterium]